MTHRFFNLPDHIWSKIFVEIDEQDLAQVSLVSKEFLSITSHVKTSLKISDETLPILPGVLQRFQNLETIIICTDPPLNHVDLLGQISRSGLDAEARKRLKKLDFRAPSHFSYKDFIAIADLFPWLEEISFPPLVYSSKNFDFQNLLTKLSELKKLVSKYCAFISDESLMSLSSICVKLEEIHIRDCEDIGEETIGFVMRNSPNLTTLTLPKLRKPSDLYDPMSIQNAIAYANNLHTISLHEENVSEELVCNLARANPTLKKLKIEFSPYSSDKILKTDGFMVLFQACPSIEHLCLNRYKHLSDSFVATFSQCLTKLACIDLGFSYQLTNASFFQLTNNCPSLEEIKMDDTSLGFGSFSQMSLQKNKKVRYLSFARNLSMGNRTLRYILYVCPNLRFLNVKYCSCITSKGVREILKACGLLTHLNIGFLKVSDIFGDYFEGRTIVLKVLKAEQTRLDDNTLRSMGKICSGLEYLSVKLCKKVTRSGVMEVVRNCKKLKRINLAQCKMIRNCIIDDVVRLGPSIKQIVRPTELFLSEEQKNLFWKNGCKICRDVWNDDDMGW